MKIFDQRSAFFLVIWSLSALSGGIFAQVPAFTISSEMPEFGAEQSTPRNITLRERRFTMLTYDSLPQRGRIVIRRTAAPTNATVTLRMGVSYQIGTRLLPEITTATVLLPNIYSDGSSFTKKLPRTETAASIPINSLQGDLEPIMLMNGFIVGRVGTTYTGVYNIAFAPNVTEASIVFTGRWSDQSFPNNPGLQGQRVATVALLPGDGYTVPPRVDASGRPLFDDVSRITLDDPVNVPPTLLPLGRQFCQMLSISGVERLLPLESSQLDSTGLPRSFFYDDNYDQLSYSLTNSAPNALSASVRTPPEPRGNAVPTLALAVNNNARSTTANLTITARDNRGGAAETVCPPINIITSVLESQAAQPLSAIPNPADTKADIQFSLLEASNVHIEVFSTLGEKVMESDEVWKSSGTHTIALDVSRLPMGVYPVRVKAGRQVFSMIMRVVR